MDLIIILFLVVIPSVIGANMHFRLFMRPKEKSDVLLTYFLYGFVSFYLPLFLKWVRGLGDMHWTAAFGTVNSLFKNGVLEVSAAVFIPLLLSFLYPALKDFIQTRTGSAQDNDDGDVADE